MAALALGLTACSDPGPPPGALLFSLPTAGGAMVGASADDAWHEIWSCRIEDGRARWQRHHFFGLGPPLPGGVDAASGTTAFFLGENVWLYTFQNGEVQESGRISLHGYTLYDAHPVDFASRAFLATGRQRLSGEGRRLLSIRDGVVVDSVPIDGDDVNLGGALPTTGGTWWPNDTGELRWVEVATDGRIQVSHPTVQIGPEQDLTDPNAQLVGVVNNQAITLSYAQDEMLCIRAGRETLRLTASDPLLSKLVFYGRVMGDSDLVLLAERSGANMTDAEDLAMVQEEVIVAITRDMVITFDGAALRSGTERWISLSLDDVP